MMAVRLINSPGLVREAVCHPAVWPHVNDFWATPDDFVFEPARWHFVIGVFDDNEYLGCFIFEIRNNSTVEVHTCLLPSAWGARANRAASLAKEWVFSETHFIRINTAVAKSNRLALAFAKRAGFSEWGVCPNTWKGEDQIFLGVSKEV